MITIAQFSMTRSATIWSLLQILSDSLDRIVPTGTTKGCRRDTIITIEVPDSRQCGMRVYVLMVHPKPMRIVVTQYDYGPDVFHNPHQGYPQFEQRHAPAFGEGSHSVHMLLLGFIQLKKREPSHLRRHTYKDNGLKKHKGSVHRVLN